MLNHYLRFWVSVSCWLTTDLLTCFLVSRFLVPGQGLRCIPCTSRIPTLLKACSVQLIKL